MHIPRTLFSLTLVLVLVGCASTSGGVQTGQQIQKELKLPEYNGPKATLAVADCEDKAGNTFEIKRDDGTVSKVSTSEITGGVEDMLITALVNSGRFQVLETQSLGALERERGYSGEGEDRLGGADLVLACAITEFAPNASGGGVGAIVGGLLGGGGVKESKAALDIRLVDAQTRSIVTAFSAEGKARDFGGLVGGGLGAGAGAGLGAFQNTPIDAALREAVIHIVRETAQATPRKYFQPDQQTSGSDTQ